MNQCLLMQVVLTNLTKITKSNNIFCIFFYLVCCSFHFLIFFPKCFQFWVWVLVNYNNLSLNLEHFIVEIKTLLKHSHSVFVHRKLKPSLLNMNWVKVTDSSEEFWSMSPTYKLLNYSIVQYVMFSSWLCGVLMT